MTDEFDLTRGLEKVQSDMPGMPNDFAILKSLIQTLPVPLPPEMRPAQGTSTAVTEPGKSLINSALAGADIGATSGAVLGSVSEIFYANSNLLNNPLWDGLDYGGITLTASDQVACHEFVGRYEIYSGNAPVGASIGLNWYRTASNNQFNSNKLYIECRPAASGASDYAIVFEGGSITFSVDSALPFLTASCKLSLSGWGIDTANVTIMRARIEIREATGAQALYAASPWLDLLPLTGEYTTRRLTAAYAKPAGYGWQDDSYRWSLRVEYSRTNNSGVDYIDIGEPTLALSATQQPPPFTPMLAKAQLPYVIGYLPGLDTFPAVHVGMSGYGGSEFPVIRMGDGTATADTRLTRGSTGRMVYDTNYAAVQSEFGIYGSSGQRVKLDVRAYGDSEARVAMWGDATMQGLQFGGGTSMDTNLYRKLSGVLKTDSRLEIGVVTKATDVPFLIREGTSNDAEFAMFGDGAMWWGAGGTNPRDTNLYRYSANQLATDDMFRVINNSGVVVSSTIGQWTLRSFNATADAQPYFYIGGSAYGGLHAWGAGGSSAVDVVLYRSAANVLTLGSGDVLGVGGTQVVGARRTGWAAASGTPTRTTFATSTVTTAQLAERVKALLDDLLTHGLIGA